MDDLSSLASFRSAGLGGFNKKDVTSYIRALSEDYEAEKSRLETALIKAKQEKEALEAKNASLSRELNMLRMLKDEDRGKVGSLSDEMEALRSENAELKEALEKSAADLKEVSEKKDADLALAEEKASSLEEENRRLSAVIEQNKKVLSRLEDEKKIVTDLEVEARIRAKDAEEAAHVRIAALVAAYQKEFSEAKESFRGYKVTADQLIGSTSSYLKELTDLFEKMGNELSLSEIAFDQLCEDPKIE